MTARRLSVLLVQLTAEWSWARRRLKRASQWVLIPPPFLLPSSRNSAWRRA